MIILEILVGSDIILTVTPFEKAEELLEICKEYLDTSTYYLLKYMLLSEGFEEISFFKYYADKIDYDTFGENVRRMTKARIHDIYLSDLIQTFKKEFKLNPEKYWE